MLCWKACLIAGSVFSFVFLFLIANGILSEEQPTPPFHSELIFRYVLRAMLVSGLYLEQSNLRGFFFFEWPRPWTR